ncbi:MAG: hypothetical protein KAJ51_01870 [Thermoplasmata archaeon]|nr:hypothetical protein [Thermoplasmata archaeon]
MKIFPENPFFRNLTIFDKMILKTFIILLIFSVSVGIIVIFILKPGSNLNELYYMLSLVMAFTLTGILALHLYSKEGIISTKKILKFFAKIATGFTVILTPLIFMIIFFVDEGVPDSTFEKIGMAIGFIIGMFLAAFVFLFFFLVIGFGLIALLAAIERGIAPEMLLHVTRITKNTTDKMKKKDLKSWVAYSGIRWVFNIPEAVDTRTLRINRGKPFKKIPWTTLRNAMIWQFIFGTLIVIYISLNPLYLEDYSFQELFETAQNFTIFVPYLVLPWFIYLRLDARNKGHAKDFNLYNGRKTRMTQTFITLGTLLIMIRLALEKVDWVAIITSFIGYYFFFFLSAFIFTFVYFNYFENMLAYDISRRYEKIKDKPSKKSGLKNRSR